MIQMNKKPTFTMMVGLPGSGKSTYAEKVKGAVICSSDAIREELTGDINSQEKNGEVFKILHQRVKENLRSGNDVIYDACNISSKRRKAFLDELKHIECEKVCFVIATPYAECLKQNQQRERRVPEDAIKRMYMNWNTPYYFEGWDRIIVCRKTDEVTKAAEMNKMYTEALRLVDFDQNSDFHSATLGCHMIETMNNVVSFMNNVGITGSPAKTIERAAILHDIGKPFTKTFKNHKGEQSETAHYYCHENVGAYDVLAKYKSNADSILKLSVLINLHMHPYNWARTDNPQKAMKKHEELWGNELFEQVMVLHAADRMAH